MNPLFTLSDFRSLGRIVIRWARYQLLTKLIFEMGMELNAVPVVSSQAGCFGALDLRARDENAPVEAVIGAGEFKGRAHQLHLLRVRHTRRERSLCERGREAHAGAAAARSQGRRSPPHSASGQRPPIVLILHFPRRQEVPPLFNPRREKRVLHEETNGIHTTYPRQNHHCSSTLSQRRQRLIRRQPRASNPKP